VAEHDGLARTPVLIEDFYTVICGYRWHEAP
jgi:hypothetical protein